VILSFDSVAVLMHSYDHTLLEEITSKRIVGEHFA